MPTRFHAQVLAHTVVLRQRSWRIHPVAHRLSAGRTQVWMADAPTVELAALAAGVAGENHHRHRAGWLGSRRGADQAAGHAVPDPANLRTGVGRQRAVHVATVARSTPVSTTTTTGSAGPCARRPRLRRAHHRPRQRSGTAARRADSTGAAAAARAGDRVAAASVRAPAGRGGEAPDPLDAGVPAFDFLVLGRPANTTCRISARDRSPPRCARRGS